MHRVQKVTVRSRGQELNSPFYVALVMALLLMPTLFTASAQNSAPSQITITVGAQGITPTTATVSAGPVSLTIENQRTTERVTLRVSNQGGELIREISVPDKASTWKTEVELGVGQYIISDLSRPTASCHITVQAGTPK